VRGTNAAEVIRAIIEMPWSLTKKDRWDCKISLTYGQVWNGRFYVNKEVRPIFVVEQDKIVVITVYVYYN
jgi:hypothetical protein